MSWDGILWTFTTDTYVFKFLLYALLILEASVYLQNPSTPDITLIVARAGEPMTYTEYLMDKLRVNYVDNFLADFQDPWSEGLVLSNIDANLDSAWLGRQVGELARDLLTSGIEGCDVIPIEDGRRPIRLELLFSLQPKHVRLQHWSSAKSQYFGPTGSYVCDFESWAEYFTYFYWGSTE